MSRIGLFVRSACRAVVALPGLFLLLPLQGDEAAEQRKAYALLIGVKTFDHIGPPLQFTENDVEELAKLLDKPGSPFRGLRPDGKTKRVRVLTSTRGKKTDADKPTAANILRELEELIGKRTSNEMVLVALASHGIRLAVSPPGAGTRGGLTRPHGETSPDARIYPFFCPSDAQLEGTEYATGKNEHLINLDGLIDKLGKCDAGKKLLLVDACRSLQQMPAARSLSVNYKQTLVPEGMGVMFSCKSGQQAQEPLELRHGLFFYFALKGLRGEAKDPASGEVTWKTLDRYVVNAVLSDCKANRRPWQTPQSFFNFVGSDPVLARLERSPLAKSNEPPRKGDGQPSRPEAQLAEKGIKNSIGMLLMPIPKGTFFMGSPPSAIRSSDEKQHEVEIPAEFFMGAYEVTQEEYKSVMGNNPSAYSEGGVQRTAVQRGDTRRFPVESVSWTDADAFCKALSALASERAARRVYRLPTEAEWEYACRGGKRRPMPFQFGNTLSVGQANFDCGKSFGGALNQPCEVGNFEPNLFGLFDMHGNVREWCSDWYDKVYYKSSPKSDPKGPTKGRSRVVRGGSWMQDGDYCRSTHRDNRDPAKPDHYTGFRVVCVRMP
jgi:formylglycine-generating enzyme required for sulfatase activity